MNPDGRRDLLALKLPPLVLTLIVAGLMLFISRMFPAGAFASMPAQAVGVALAVVGAIIAASGVFAFRSAGTTVDPRCPENTTQLVQHGIYSLSRNPMYLGFLLLLLGWGLWLHHAAALLMVPFFIVYMNRFQIRHEERYMRDIFGDEFESYARRVRRWI